MHISTKCSIAIHCLIFISEYGETQKITSELLSLSTGVNPVTIRGIISALKKEGILQVKFGTGGTKLNCPLEEITLYRICRAVDYGFLNKLIGLHPMPSPICPVGKNIHEVLIAPYAKIRKDVQNSFESISMKEIMDSYHNHTHDHESI